MRVVVCDAGPIIHLYEAQCLPLLMHTGNLFLPNRVYYEVQASIQISEKWPKWLEIIKLDRNEVNEAKRWQSAGGLHDGESEAIVLARKQKANWFLTDDSATRLFVSLLGFEVHGSLGVILWNAAHRNIKMQEAEEALSRLEKSSLWLSAKIYQEARDTLKDIFTET